jgi:hypothetical protein
VVASVVDIDPLGLVLKDSGLEDFYPADETEHGKMLSWCNQAFTAGDQARREYERRWQRYYRQYRSSTGKRLQGDWQSKVFYPIAFWVVEAIAPRLVASLPKMKCLPMGPEDVGPALLMEQLLDWAAEQSDLYIQLVMATKGALKYGTGILKTYERKDVRRHMVTEQGPMKRQVMKRQQAVMDPENPMMPMLNIDGEPITESKEVLVGYLPGEPQRVSKTYVAYDGPAAEAIDIMNFWPAPEAIDIDSARYVIHRTYREMSYINRRIKEGIYRLPKGMSSVSVTNISDDPHLKRLQEIGLGSQDQDPTRRPVELMEFWTDDGRVITMANRKAIIRAHQNPFDHGEKPFVRIVDYLAEHEFWGIGELEPLEGLQDLMNAIVNQRVDNVRLVLNSMFAVNTKYIEDIRDVVPRPGGVIRIKDDIPVQQVFQRIDMGNVTQQAFEEAQATEAIIEKTSGVTAYQLGTDSQNLASTATGISLIQEAGATRFGLKTRLAELMGLKHLARQFASLLQQFTTEERVVRMLGPAGEVLFQTFDPEALEGAFDFNIETASSAQTESQRRADSMNLLTTLANYQPQAVHQLSADLLQAFGKKNVDSYLNAPMPMMPGQVMQNPTPSANGAGGAPPPAAPPSFPPPTQTQGAYP